MPESECKRRGKKWHLSRIKGAEVNTAVGAWADTIRISIPAYDATFLEIFWGVRGFRGANPPTHAPGPRGEVANWMYRCRNS